MFPEGQRFLWAACISMLLGGSVAHAQNSKTITSYSQAWYSINTITRFSDYWGVMADFHARTTDFMANNYFYFARVGALYWVDRQYPVGLGYAHLWLAPDPGSSTWSNENRVYQQFSALQTMGRVSLLSRFRLEERWIDNIINDQKVGPKQYSTRLRYLASMDIHAFRNDKLPLLVFSDELLVQFGKSVPNAFDQNRMFVGIKFQVAKNLGCDIGYMNILQQLSTGTDYTVSHVFRWFFYYSIDKRKGDLDRNQHYENIE